MLLVENIQIFKSKSPIILSLCKAIQFIHSYTTTLTQSKWLPSPSNPSTGKCSPHHTFPSQLQDLTTPYSYVLLTAASTFFLGFWHGGRCGVFRKAAGPTVTYPTPYADSAHMAAASSPEQKKALYLFNCAQRAHGNYLENHPSVLAAMLISGLRYPVASALMGVGWSVCRVLYAIGYTKADRNDGKGRLVGAPMWLFQLGLYGLTGFVGYKLAF